MTIKTGVLSILATSLVTACASTSPALSGRLDTQLGVSTKANIAAQAVAPTDKQKHDTYIPADPAREALARKNYRENTVQEPKRASSNGK